MASKRQLYQPAPKVRAGERKGRKPLVQGRLTSVDCIAPNTVAPSLHDHQSFVSIPRNRPRNDELQDPSITPRKSIPALTEIMSPQPEPPSRYLDLSDADLGINESSALGKQQPIMVCDASYLASSPNHTEVDVIVEYEDSPARVVCHTPGRLERSLRSNATSASSSKKTVTVEAPKSVGLPPIRLFSDSHPQDNRSRSESGIAEPLISQHSRGLITEILAEEMGSENVDAISLYSHNSSSPQNLRISPLKYAHDNASNNYPSNSSPIIDENKPSNLTYSGDRSSNARSQATFDTSSPKCVGLPNDFELSKPKELLKKGKAKHGKGSAIRVGSDDSDSETLSLYEYVTPKTPTQKIMKGKTNSGNTVKTPGLSQTSDNSSIAKSAKKTKSKRVVSSRYKQAAAALKVSTTSLVKDSSSESSVSRSLSKQKFQMKPSESTKAKAPSQRHIITKKALSKTIAPQTSSAHFVEQKVARRESPLTELQNNSDSGKESEKMRQTSTPTHDCSGLPNYMDASSIQSVSALLVDGSMNFSKLSEQLDYKIDHRTASTKGNLNQELSDKYLPVSLDIDYSRYLQACFFSSKVRKIYKEQDEKATKDLNSLWNLVEKQREEVSKVERELIYLKQIHELDNFLERTEPEISAVIPKLPQVEADYVKLCQALDTTRHQIPTKDIHLPPEDEEVRDAYENKMEAILKESEMLLNEINKVMEVRSFPLSQYRTCLDAVKQNVGAIGTQLREGQTDLEKAQGLCTRLASLTALDYGLMSER